MKNFLEKYDWYKIRQYQKELDELNDSYHKSIESMKKNRASRDDLDSKYSIWSFERSEYEDEIEKIKTKQIRKKAYKKNILLPEYSEEKMWDTDYYHEEKYLSPQGKRYMTLEFRHELHDKYKMLIQLIGMIVGLIGAITGLIAVIAA